MKFGGAAITLVAVSAVVALAVRGRKSEPAEPARLAGEYGPYQDEHGDHTPRAKDDPNNAHIRGAFTEAGNQCKARG